MAICKVCNQEMLTADSCEQDQKRIAYGLETVWAEYNIKGCGANRVREVAAR
jgi:hypothetical protein